MMAWYSRDRSSCRPLMRSSRVTDAVALFLAPVSVGMTPPAGQIATECGAPAPHSMAQLRIGASLVPRLAQVLVEVGDGAIPRQLGGGGVVAWRRVVVETMLGVGIDETLVLDVGRLQRRFVRGPAI